MLAKECETGLNVDIAHFRHDGFCVLMHKRVIQVAIAVAAPRAFRKTCCHGLMQVVAEFIPARVCWRHDFERPLRLLHPFRLARLCHLFLPAAERAHDPPPLFWSSCLGGGGTMASSHLLQRST